MDKLPEDVRILIRQFRQKPLYYSQLLQVIEFSETIQQKYSQWTTCPKQLMLNKARRSWSDKRIIWLLLKKKPFQNHEITQISRRTDSDGFELVTACMHGPLFESATYV